MIVIVDIVGANIKSLCGCLDRLDLKYKIFHRKEDLTTADYVILSGVGSACNAMQELSKHDLVQSIKSLKIPVLGICVGMQIMFQSSSENFLDKNNTQGLGIIPEKIIKLQAVKGLSVPHSGWNKIISNENTADRYNLTDKYVYFVHSYYAPLGNYTDCYVNYSVKISAVVSKDNFTGLQFHPEKSAKVGGEFFQEYFKQ